MKKKIVLVIMVAVIAMTGVVMLAGCDEGGPVKTSAFEISSILEEKITDSKDNQYGANDKFKISETYFYTATINITLKSKDYSVSAVDLKANITISNCEVAGTYSTLSQGEVTNGEINIDGETNDKSDIKLTLSEVNRVFPCQIKLTIKPKKNGELHAKMMFNTEGITVNDIGRNTFNLVSRIVEKTKLDAPILTYDSNNLSFSWVPVDNAVGYIIYKNGVPLSDKMLGPTVTTYLLQESSCAADNWCIDAIGDDNFSNSTSKSITGIIA